MVGEVQVRAQVQWFATELRDGFRVGRRVQKVEELWYEGTVRCMAKSLA